MRRLHGRLKPLETSDHMNLAIQAKSWLKRAAANLLYWTGALSLLVRRRLKGRAIVLMYHRVLPEDLASQSFSHPGMIVSPETFKRHMELVRRKFLPLSLDEFMAHMEAGRPFPDRACLVTFDDGWVDNHEFALPILREQGIPAVVFVATDYIDSDRPFWQEHLGYLLYEASRRGLRAADLGEHQVHLPVESDESRLRQAVAAAVDRFRGESYDSIGRLTRALEHALEYASPPGDIQPPDRFMTWDQVRSLASNQITIASHTRSHRALPRLDAAVVAEELADSRRTLADRIGNDVTALAYPGGFHDALARQAAIDCGYRLAFTTHATVATPKSDCWLVPRMNIHESATRTVSLFLSRMAGLL